MTFLPGLVIIIKDKKGRALMEIYNFSLNDEKTLDASVVALGLFDGVHRGHRALLSAARTEAKSRGVPFAVFTFISEDSTFKGSSRLYSTKIKIELLEREGADLVILANFTDIADISAESFVKEILIKRLGAHLAVTGNDFRFGKGREGNSQLLEKIMSESGGRCLFVPDETLFGKKISTTLVKELLSQGECSMASELLGTPYFIEGTVERGDGRGKKLGLPTINTPLGQDKDFLRSGVYHSLVKIGENLYTGLTNIGKCPTFQEREIHAETFMLDFSGTIYGEQVRIYLVSYMRDEMRFESPELLVSRIKSDIEKVRGEKTKWQENGIN